MKGLESYIGRLVAALVVVLTGAAGAAWGATPQIAAGSNHTVFLHGDGTLWSAGLNLSGQLGDGTLVSRESQVHIGQGSAWKAVSAGADHTLALGADGTLWGWGRNDSGQLGVLQDNGSAVGNQKTPLQIGSEKSWVAVAAGQGSSYALKGDGTLWGWGGNASGQLGNGGTVRRDTPFQVLNPGGGRYVAIAAGAEHALALKSDGTLWGWGRNDSGQLGDGGTTAHATPVQLIVAGAPSDNDWTAIAAGSAHSLALKADGTLWSFGGNGSGQLGIGSTALQTAPVQVGTDRDWAKIAAGSLHSVAVKRNGTLWTFGDNRSGQLGSNLTAQSSSPVRIPSPSGVIAVCAGAFHSLAAAADGTIYAWGDNGTGQFGNGQSAGSLVPVAVGNAGSAWIATEEGTDFSVALRSDGTLWNFGANAQGQLGDGSQLPRNTPAKIGSARNWIAQSSGFSHTVALSGDGTLWSWGDNFAGQLGDGSVDPSFLPLQVTATAPGSAADDWAAVAAGDFHTLALKGDGTLWSWGDNALGQLGINSNTPNQKLPNQVVTGNPGNFDSNWVAIAAGGSHSLALQADGTLWGWGDNSTGQLGDPLIIGSIREPSQIINFTLPAGNPGFNSNWKSISAGLGHSLALQADGTAWGWGGNFFGQLGNGTSADQPAPVQVLNQGGVPYLALSAGDAHSAALAADGTLWSFGRNTGGQLGIGSADPDPFSTDPPTLIAHPTPLPALGISGWVSASAGGGHTIALNADGTLWGMGGNASGQLGDSSTTDRNVPTPLLEGILTAPASVDFSVVAVNAAPAILPLTISNAGNGVLFVTSLTLTGADSPLFGLSAGSCPSATSFALPAKGSCTLNVAFSAPQEGGKSAALLIDSSDPVLPQAQVGLSGTSAVPFTVSTAVTGSGSISPAGPVQALPGTTPVFAITAGTGNHVQSVTVNGVQVGALTSVRMTAINANAEIVVTFAPDVHTVTLTPGAHGSITGPTSVTFGGTPTYTITPDPGSFITDVTVAGVSLGAVSTVTLPAVQGDITIAATFGVTTFGVSASSDARGTISPAGTTQVPYGGSQSYQFTPHAGYNVVQVLVDGVAQGAIPSYTFSNMTGGTHTIRVICIPDGDLTGDGLIDVADALKALRIAVDLDQAAPAEMLHGDVAPFDAAGIPVPDHQITVGDALGILRKAVGISSAF